MAQKGIRLEIDTDGNITTEYNGFPGNDCYQEASRLKAALAKYGLNIETLNVQPKRDEVEVRPLTVQQKVGR